MMSSIISMKIKYARSKNNMTINELAKATNLSSIAIEQFEKNIRSPSPSALEKIAKALNTNVEFLLGKAPKM